MPLTRDSVFNRVQVDYALTGIARVSWDLRTSFTDVMPHYFQLQVNRNYDEPDDWVDVGTLGTNNDYALDDEQRQYGKNLRVGYRVVLTTTIDEYTSPVAQVLGNLSMRQWLLARAIIRRVRLKHRRLASFPGYIFKRKLHGTRCTVCLDPITGAALNSDCETCHGTGKVDGYWQAAQNIMFDVTPESENTRETERGTINDTVVMGSFIGVPVICRGDVWLDSNSDRRYYIHQVKPTAELNRVPLVITAELRLAEFSDTIYNVPLEGS